MKGAIFDMDGTLLDSMGVWNNITKIFFDKYNIAYSKEDAERFREMTLQESSLYIKEKFLPGMSDSDVLNELNALAAHEYMHNITFKPYAVEYLSSLHAQGVKLAIATSGFAQLCNAVLERHGIRDLFSAIALSSEVGVNKSNPDVYLLAAERIGVAPADCTVFEDILLGVQGAKKAGMTVVGVYDESSKDYQAEIQSAADRYIMSWKELI